MSFEPRLSKPAGGASYWSTNKYYLTVSQGGYNRCIPVWNGVMPNCVGYAYGRFMEIGGVTSCNLSTANAGLWYGNTADGYERGSTPRLGAVICYSNPGKAGHVAIVEQINADGSIVISESGYQSTSYFWTSTRYPPDYKYGSTYIFQGFIYNPFVANTTKVESFVSEAKSKINLSFSGKSSNKNDCSADFVVNCADAVGGLTGVIIPNCIYPSKFAQKGINSGMGSFIDSSKKSAQPGDIILIRDIIKNALGGYTSDYACDDIGIVVETGSNKAVVIIAESSNKIRKKEYRYSSSTCHGFYRPNWSKVDNNASLVFGYGSLGKYYDTENTEEDATIREVGYLSTGYEPTTSKTKIRLSVVNYTTIMSAIMDDLIVPVTYSSSSDNVILDGVENQNARIIISQLMSKGLNAAAAVGICANIKHESNYNPSIVEYGYTIANGGVGLCQWTNSPRAATVGRRTNMINMVGSNWRNDITGQIDFLWYEMQNDSSLGLSAIQTVPNTEAGARQAADIFVRKFERPAKVDSASQTRQNTASELWSQIIIQVTSTSGSSTGIMNTTVMSGREVVIPSSVNQSGISSNYTNYSYWYSRWASSSVQRKIADKWNAQGRPSNRGIATIDGFYLCAVTLIFGTTGDKISIVLEDNTIINAIIADSKGDDPSKNGESGNIYGHIFGNGKIDVIEWERVGSSTSYNSPSAIDLSGWQGKKVSKIINGGAYSI